MRSGWLVHMNNLEGKLEFTLKVENSNHKQSSTRHM